MLFAPYQAAPAPTEPEPTPLKVPYLGLNVGTFVPTSALTRSRFGGNWQTFSPGLGTVLPSLKPTRLPDFSLATRRRSVGGFNNKAFLVLLGIQQQWPLFTLSEDATRLPTFLPYAGVGAGATYANLRSGADNVNGSAFGASASAYVGTSIGLNAFIEARYRLLSPIKGFNLSGTQVSIGLRF